MKLNTPRFHLLSLMLLLSVIVSNILYAQPDPWKISADNIRPDNYYGIAVANGMIGILSSPQPLKVESVVLAGTYDLYGRGRVSNFLNSFNLLNLNLYIDGQSVSGKNLNGFSQTLDMQHAVFCGSGFFNGKADIHYRYFALRQLPYCVMMEVTVKAEQDIDISATNLMQAPDAMRDVQNYFNEINRPHANIALMTSSGKSPTGKLTMCASTCFLFPETVGKEPRVLHEMWDSNMHRMSFSKHLNAGESYTFSLVGTSITSAHNPDPLNEAERLTLYAKLEGHDRLIERHEKAWSDLWKSDIQIEGDAQSQQDIHSMLYHLYSFYREGSPYSLSPMGLSGLGYNGHVFWDTDLWMFRVYLIMHPEMAKSLLNYRFNRLNVAHENAFSHGYGGAMFPWESADSGVEETPVWALSGPFEHHITACVANASWDYYCVSQDKTWLREKAWPVLSATADFWISRAEINTKGGYDIKNVVAADEWAENVDNDAFTNAAARQNLLCASKAAKILGLPDNKQWTAVAQKLEIPRFDDGTTKEHAAYNGEPIKQADVNLLAYPLKLITDQNQIKKDLEYYETRVPNEGTPAMTQAIFALLYSRLGNADKAFHFFKDAYIPNLLPPFNVIAETKGGTNPYFATGAGGVLQSLIFGFGGLDLTDNGIVQIKSALPSGWKSVKITGVGPEHKIFIIKQ